ncbi:NAD(P)-dependent oxidoreductase [Geothrix sp. PMB-07]|uniref:NAD(P)-dependent oxidoreductase n=1 Tax=Geothrix sp. PMB-07 TaxID=3068640 RepID=UPI002740FBA0|nr:NAD(P)-dependent oxidoreductase [Geothrix sp. PMB-07]WLT33290.1 NAD(P)-dependent oxidoreductase [Geothrix sp. PMB-07]
MNITLIGASGFIGSGLLKEALSRGHQVTALVTRPDRLAPHPQLRVLQADIADTPTLANLLRGHDAVISAFSGHAQPDVRGYYVKGMQSLIAAVKESGVPRLLVVGGAGSLDIAPGQQLLDSPDFPAEYRGTAEGNRDILTLLRADTHLDWTMLSPSASIHPGERTGQFRLGEDTLLVDASGTSHISLEDYAVAMLDELERPTHVRRRFTVGY